MRRTAPGLLLICMVFGCITGCASDLSGLSRSLRSGYEEVKDLDYQAAEESFKAAISSGEDIVQSYRGLGLALMGQARYQEAAEAFTNALSQTDDKMEETVKDLLLYKASAQYRMRDYSGTIQTADSLVGIDDTLAPAYFFRGAAWLCQGEQDKAKVNFDYAVTLSRQDYELYLDIYQVYDDNKLSGIGDEYLGTALSIAPEGNEAHYHIGQIYFYLEQFDQAKEALIEPVKDRYVPALNLMGQIYLAEGDLDNARATFTQVVGLDGPSPETCNGLALCALEADDPDTALRYIAEGLDLPGNDGKKPLYYNEIIIYERKLDFANALAKCEVYASLYPTDEDGQKELTFLRSRA